MGTNPRAFPGQTPRSTLTPQGCVQPDQLVLSGHQGALLRFPDQVQMRPSWITQGLTVHGVQVLGQSRTNTRALTTTLDTLHIQDTRVNLRVHNSPTPLGPSIDHRPRPLMLTHALSGLKVGMTASTPWGFRIDRQRSSCIVRAQLLCWVLGREGMSWVCPEKAGKHLIGQMNGNHFPIDEREVEYMQCKGGPGYLYQLAIDILAVLRSQGIEPHPGPPNKIANTFTFCSINVTNGDTHKQDIADADIDCMFVQEHSQPPMACQHLQRYLRKHRKHGILGPLDPEATRPLGGVGAIGSHPHRPVRMAPTHELMIEAEQSGRVMLFSCNVGISVECYFLVIYGWTGGAESKHAAARTDQLVQAGLKQIELCPQAPTFILGDLNAEPDQVASIHQLLTDRHWVDVGAVASTWGGSDLEHTCIAPTAKQATRRDFVFCSPQAFPLIQGFKVDHSTSMPVHAMLVVTLRVDNCSKSIVVNETPHSYANALREHYNSHIGSIADLEHPSAGTCIYHTCVCRERVRHV